MSSLQTARDALEAELFTARQGMAHYQSRAAGLQATIAALDAIIAPGGSPSAQAEPTKQDTPAPVAARKPAKRAKIVKKSGAGPKANSSDLPFTGGDYWTNLLSDQPKSGPEVMKAAIGGLGFKPSKEQIGKLAGRMTFALNTLVKAKKIHDSGSGRERRFFK